jgi:hypothetical protein
MDTVGLLGLALGVAFAAGLNTYATVVVLGLLERFHLVHLPQGLEVLAHPLVLAVAATMYVVEFVADKVPYVDNVWDVIHTFIRPAAAAALAFGAFSGAPESWKAAAALAAGSFALASHGAKASARAAVNSSPEPFSNSVLSLAEDVAAIGLSWAAATHPFVTLAVVSALAVLCVVAIVKLLRFFSRVVRRVLLRGESAPGLPRP